MKSIPNIMTCVRLLLVPLCGYYLFNEQYVYAAIIYICASVTDIADGYIARKFNLVTNIGKILDPLADKILSFTTLTILSYRERIHLIIPMLILIKELLIALGGFVMYKKRHLVKGASWYGKCATVLFFVSILLVMFDKTLLIGQLLIVAALAFSYFALIMYIREYVLIMSKQSERTSC